MKRMCRSVSGFLALLVCLVAVGMVSGTQAQTRDKFLISAKAGGVNLVTGNVTVIRKGTSGQLALTDKDNLESGDVVTTGMDGRVEVLLNPGSYLRVSENSEFQLADTSLENMRVKLIRGSAIIEAVGGDGTDVRINVETRQMNAVIIRHGIYRFNVLPTSMTEILVLKGRVQVSTLADVVKDGKKVIIGGGSTEVVKLDKKSRDSFDLWSRDRAEYLASLNRTIPSYLISQTFDSFGPDWLTGFGRPAGIWFRASNNCYVFVPTYYGIWSSPYGYNYPSGYRRCCGNSTGNNGQPIYEQPPGGYENPRPGRRRRNPGNNPPPQGNPGGGGNSGGGGSVSQPSEPSAPSRPEPATPAPAPEPSTPAPAPAPVQAPSLPPPSRGDDSPSRVEPTRVRDPN
ncbi:MAG: FecR domain-containing protein [Pyrinomonadaceae bacterium]|nr:FecR domain-containing protein [Pyrinomonadaceae bacterium]